MPYKCKWSLTLVGEGRLLPLTDPNNIMTLFQNIVTSLIQNAYQDVDLKRTHIHYEEIESE